MNDGDGSDRFVFSTLNLDAADIAWLEGALSDKSRARRLLVRLLENSPDRSVLAIQRDTSAREAIFNLLLGDIPNSASQIASLLTLGELQINEALDIGPIVLPSMSLEEGARLANHLIARALVEADPKDARVSCVISYPALAIRPQQLIQMATSKEATNRRIGTNIVLLAEISPDLRKGIVAHIDDLSDRLIHRGRRTRLRRVGANDP